MCGMNPGLLCATLTVVSSLDHVDIFLYGWQFALHQYSVARVGGGIFILREKYPWLKIKQIKKRSKARTNVLSSRVMTLKLGASFCFPTSSSKSTLIVCLFLGIAHSFILQDFYFFYCHGSGCLLSNHAQIHGCSLLKRSALFIFMVQKRRQGAAAV